MRRCSIFGGGLPALIAGLAAVVPTAGHAQAQSTPPACVMHPAGSASVRAVRDGRTVMLSDGRELRLAGIETPPPDSAAGLAAKSALETFVGGREVALKTLGSGKDRYGRVVAYIFLPGADSEQSVQLNLLSSGHARAAARIGDAACAQSLLAAERDARSHSRGLWADPAFAPRDAGQIDDILRLAGGFTLVSGKVLSVRESGATIYVNFGTRWSRDFTVTMLKRNQRLFAAAGIEPKKLEGRKILVRGVIEQRGGPVIEAMRPEQIEIVSE